MAMFNLDALGAGIRSLLEHPSLSRLAGSQQPSQPFGDFAQQATTSLWGGQSGYGGQPGTSLWGGQGAFGQAPTSLWDAAGGSSGGLFGGGSPVYGAPGSAFDKLGRMALTPIATPSTLGKAATTGAKAAGPVPLGGTSGNWSGPATADDNKGITADKVNQVIAQTRANSPMIGKGQLILDYANQRGVSVPEMMGIFLAESELGTTAGPGWNVAGVGGAGNFTGYATIDDAIKGAIDNLATDTYRGKSLQEQIGTWFVGPQGWASGGLNASDGQNGTVGDYIGGKVAPMYNAFGVPLNQAQAPSRTAGGGKGLASITGGQVYPIMQEFGDTTYSAEHPDTYAYAGAYGAHGHTGIDWNAPLGTSVYTPVGGTVSVVGNDHGSGYYFTNTMTQSDRDHSGEFAITLANGDILILGHMSSINAQVGQQLAPGTLIGLSGGSDGPHVHIEYRQKQADGSYRIIDPRTVLGN